MQWLMSLNNKRFYQQHALKISAGVAAFIVLLVTLYIGINLRSDYLAKKRDYQAQPIQANQNRQTKPFNVNEIVSANLFGNPRPVTTTQVSAPKTRLNLTLQGILFTNDKNLARAIIGVGKKASELYSVGDNITQTSAKVHEIRHNEVILDRNGVLESLPLIQKKSDTDLFVFSKVETNVVNSTTSASLSTTQQNTNLSRPSKARSLRKPNFSGLDRKLQRMGEL